MAARQPQTDPLEQLAQLAADAAPDADEAPEDESAPPAISIESVTNAINALASAWSTFRLYPNPVDQPGFRQALDNLDTAAAGGITIEVGPGSLAVGDTTVGTDRGSVEQFATRLFIHDVDKISIRPPADPKELCQLFGLMVLDRAGAEDMGGLEALGEDLKSVQITLRGILRRDPEDEDGGDDDEDAFIRQTEIARLIDEGADADEVHNKLIEISGGNDDKLRMEFVRSFREIHADAMTTTSSTSLGDMLLPYIVDDIGPSPTGTFIEVYFRLPPKTRSEILEAFLISSMKDESRMFLDQFSGDELAELVPSISAEGFEALLEYARATTEVPGEDEALLRLLKSAREVRSMRVETAARISDLVAALEVAPASDADETLREQLAADRHASYGVGVARGLFATVTEDERFARLAEVWAGRVRDRLYRGEIREATGMLRAILDDPPYPQSRASVVDNALAELMTAQLTQEATSQAVGERKEQVIEFMSMLGSPAVRRVMERLAIEEDAAKRRSLIDLLAVLAKDNPTPLLASLSDDRWYVVRNVVAVLAKTGLPLAAEPIRQAAAHADPRVRVEALRGLVTLDNREAAPNVLSALADPEERVRSAALKLLRSLHAGSFEKTLTEMLIAATAPHGTLTGIAEYLVEHVPDSIPELEAAANRKLALKAAQRASRAAARTALRSDDDG